MKNRTAQETSQSTTDSKMDSNSIESVFSLIKQVDNLEREGLSPEQRKKEKENLLKYLLSIKNQVNNIDLVINYMERKEEKGTLKKISQYFKSQILEVKEIINKKAAADDLLGTLLLARLNRESDKRQAIIHYTKALLIMGNLDKLKQEGYNNSQMEMIAEEGWQFLRSCATKKPDKNTPADYIELAKCGMLIAKDKNVIQILNSGHNIDTAIEFILKEKNYLHHLKLHQIDGSKLHHHWLSGLADSYKFTLGNEYLYMQKHNEFTEIFYQIFDIRKSRPLDFKNFLEENPIFFPKEKKGELEMTMDNEGQLVDVRPNAPIFEPQQVVPSAPEAQVEGMEQQVEGAPQVEGLTQPEPSAPVMQASELSQPESKDKDKKTIGSTAKVLHSQIGEPDPDPKKERKAEVKKHQDMKDLDQLLAELPAPPKAKDKPESVPKEVQNKKNILNSR